MRALGTAEDEVERLRKLYAEVVDRLYGQIGRLTAERDEARQIAALCYEARVGDPSAVDAAIEAWLNRSWKPDVASTGEGSG